MKATVKILLVILALTQVLTLTNLKEESIEEAKIQMEKDLFQQAIDDHHETLTEEEEEIEKANQEHINQIEGTTKYVCTGGVKPSSLSRKDYIKAFNKGPCAPIVLLAGISGTKLQVKIDCPTFRANNLMDFNACGWTSCSGTGAPQSEYLIWVPRIGSEMSVVNPSDAKRKCFTALIGYDIQALQTEGVVRSKKGLTVYPTGLSPATKNKSESDCGMDGIVNLIPTKIQFSGYSQYRD